ncbi:uncharacterized protein LOC142239554 [Haematobia irritans]|uniref:uncharacterized protein LOC142239554 n=1 Tax=Haematobia irritans TaxID=7368 RepID=UPI003F4F6127
MSFDDSILANIKKHDSESDDNDDDCDNETYMEEYSFIECEEKTLDPLLGNDEKVVKKEFRWQCTGNDFLKPYEDEQDGEYDCSGNKVGRADMRGSNGQPWSKVPLTPPIADDLPGCTSGGKGPAKCVSNPLEAWHLFIDVPMLNQLVKNTNEVMKSRKKKESHQKRSTDLSEIRSWIGLNYLCGVLRNSAYPGPLEELWTLEMGNAIFRATMSYRRFQYLSECIRIAERREEGNYQSLDEIADFWEKLVINCRSYYSPSDFSMIDESILDFTVDPQSPFSHTLSSQPDLKGLRVVTMCDAKTLYMCNAIVGSHEDPLDEEVCQLVNDIKSSRRCVCLNQRYSSIGLMEKLKHCQLQVVGALAQTAHEIPAELCHQTTIPQVWYTENDTSLIAGLERSVSPTRFLLTSCLSTRINAVKLYQALKDSNEKSYSKLRTYSTRHSSTRSQYPWSLEFFYFMLDISSFNAWIIYRLSENGNADMEQRDFQRQLGLYMTQQQLKQRMQMKFKLPLPLKLQIAEVLGENVETLISGAKKSGDASTRLNGSIPSEKAFIQEGITLQSRENETRRRCRKCKTRNGSIIKTRCQQCLLPFCLRHLIARCEKCSGYELNQPDDSGRSGQ